MKAAFLSEDWTTDRVTGAALPSAVSFYRQWLPMNCLPERQVMGKPAWTGATGFGVKDSAVSARFGFDTVSLKLLRARWVPHQIKAARSIGQRVVNDVDDFYDGIDYRSIAHRVNDPKRNRVANWEHYRDAIMESDTVTVSTPFLRDHYLALGHPDVRMVRNGVNPMQLRFREPVYRKPVVGWVGAVDWRSGDLEAMKEWLPGFLRENRLRFHHSGHVPGQEPLGAVLGLPEGSYSWTAMAPFNRLHTLYSFDIGIVPLTDVPFNHAKSALKGLEYAAAGVPFVADRLPEYAYIESTGCGRTASGPDEWLPQLGRLLDFGCRRDDAKRNFQSMMEHHTIIQRVSEWRSVYGYEASGDVRLAAAAALA